MGTISGGIGIRFTRLALSMIEPPTHPSDRNEVVGTRRKAERPGIAYSDRLRGTTAARRTCSDIECENPLDQTFEEERLIPRHIPLVRC